jgi:hypothetical protein
VVLASTSRPNIPDVCTAFGIKCMGVLDLIKAEKWVSADLIPSPFQRSPVRLAVGRAHHPKHQIYATKKPQFYQRLGFGAKFLIFAPCSRRNTGLSNDRCCI